MMRDHEGISRGRMAFFRALLILVREVFNRTQRFRLLYHLFRDFPGDSGYEFRRIVLRKHFEFIGEDVSIAPGFRFWNIEKISLGNRVRFADDDYIQGGGGVTIGDDTILGPCVKIWSQNHVFEDPDRPIIGQGYEFARVIIGKRCWIGANAFVMPGVELGDGCIVSAGAVVGAKKIPPYSILAGNPARVIGNRRTALANQAAYAPQQSGSEPSAA